MENRRGRAGDGAGQSWGGCKLELKLSVRLSMPAAIPEAEPRVACS